MSEFSLKQSVADTIGKLILDKFTEVMADQGQHSRLVRTIVLLLVTSILYDSKC